MSPRRLDLFQLFQSNAIEPGLAGSVEYPQADERLRNYLTDGFKLHLLVCPIRRPRKSAVGMARLRPVFDAV